MKNRICALAFVVAPLACAGLVKADGILLPLDPLTNFMLYSQNTNDGYSSFRGMVFIADEALAYNGAALFTASSNGLNVTFELYEIFTTVGNVLNGANLVRSTSGLLQGSLGFHGLKFDDITLIPDQAYLLRVGYEEAADENWFYDFDPVVFGDLPVDIGPVTLIDGTLGGDTSNFVAPPLALQIVPAPATLALLGLAGLAGVRRRRR